MKKSLWLILLSILFVACTSVQDASVSGNELQGTELSALPKPTASKSNFSAYFSTIDAEVLLNIQNGTPASLQKALTNLRNNYDTSVEQVGVLAAITSTIMEYAWPSSSIAALPYADLPVNVYTSTIESIHNGIYENAFESSDFFSLTLPSLVLFSNEQSSEYYADALESLEKSLLLDDNSVLTLYLLGTLNLRMGNNADAQRYLKKALDQDGNNVDIVYAYFTALLQSGDAQVAYNFSQNILTTYPSDVKILELSSLAAFNIENYSAAESLIAQALQSEPSNTSFLLFRAKVLFELGNYFDVSSLLDVYSRTNSQNKDYLLLRSRLQNTWNKNMPSALITIEEALTLYGDDDEVLLLAASLASESAERILGKTALDLLAQVLENDPQNIQALGILVKESIAQRAWQDAYNASIMILSQEDATLESILQHVEICIALNLLSEARDVLTPFYTPDSTNEGLQQWHIRLLIAERMYNEAQGVIARLLPTATGRMKSILYYERSRLQSTDERILSDLRSSLTSNPRNDFALYGLYEYYYERNDYSKAQYYLKQVIALNPSNVDALERNAELDTLLR